MYVALKYLYVASLSLALFGCHQSKETGHTVIKPDTLSLKLPGDKHVELEAISNGKKINGKFVDASGNDVNLQDYVKTGSKLVFRFTEMDCRPCVDQEISRIKDLSTKIGHKNLLILADYENPRGLKIFVKQNGILCTVLNCASLEIPIDSGDVSPYAFVLNRNLIANHIYTIDRLKPQKTADYYAKIANEEFDLKP